MRRGAWALGALACALLGCSMRPPRVGELPPALADQRAERDYQQVLERYTVHREVYALLDTRFLAAATFQSPSFRVARVKRLAAFQSWPSELLTRTLAEEEQQAGQFHEFFFGVHMNTPRYDDFDKKDSVWRIALVTEAGQLAPSSVERVGRSNLNLRALYPYLDDFWVAYRIRFPTRSVTGEPLVPPGTKALTLRVASTLGQADFTVPAE